MSGYLLGYDIGSSTIKASLLEIETGCEVVSATSPATELPILAPQLGWAEQDPIMWWQHLVAATNTIRDAIDVRKLKRIQAIGVSYQMHGLVLVDSTDRVLRPAIIWCDSRAVELGSRALRDLGSDKSLRLLLNSPGNFTASKMRWVIENEPAVAAATAYMLLPGDYIVSKLTGEYATTPSGLSEGILWNYKKSEMADFLVNHFGIDRNTIPPLVANFGHQGTLTKVAASSLGLSSGIPITYRAGDQPNNALSLGVLEPGDVAATAGTSGVVYGVTEKPSCDLQQRVNTFVHLNYTKEKPRFGVLLCLNGTGILYNWLRSNCMGGGSYDEMNAVAATSPIGADGLVVLPFGNGAERMFENQNLQASVHGLAFNTHHQGHLFRAGQEGIAFSLAYGLDLMRKMSVDHSIVRAGKSNLFLSKIFRDTFATASGTVIELYDTDGAQGAARGAGIGLEVYNQETAFVGLRKVEVVSPVTANQSAYQDAYFQWLSYLKSNLNQINQ